jgi:hypothetical protein
MRSPYPRREGSSRWAARMSVDDPDSIAAWVAAVEQIEPLIWSDGEREEYERCRTKHRVFNVEAVRKQMHEPPGGDGL